MLFIARIRGVISAPIHEQKVSLPSYDTQQASNVSNSDICSGVGLPINDRARHILQYSPAIVGLLSPPTIILLALIKLTRILFPNSTSPPVFSNPRPL